MWMPKLPYSLTPHVRDSCLCLHAQRAARVLARRFDDALRPAALTNGQFSLLMALNRPQPASMGEIAQLLGADRTTLTAAVKNLMGRGLVDVSADRSDQRIRRLSLSPEGIAALARAVPLWQACQDGLERVIGSDKVGPIRRELLTLAGA
jgi:DNA-binding MarR family transcriptional regulator